MENQEGMETFVAVDDAGNRVPVQVVRSGDNLVIFLNEGQSIEGVTSALQGMADGSGGGQDQYQIMVTDNYLEGQQVEGVQQEEGFQQVDQQVEDGSQVQEVQPVIDMEPEQTFSTETYQQYQVDEMVQGVQGVQVQPVSESGEVLDAFVPEVARAEGQEGEATVTTFIPTIEGAAEPEGQNTFVSIASGSESEGVNAFVSAVASGFQEPVAGGQSISNIPIDSNFTQYDQTAVTYTTAEVSGAGTSMADGQFEQTTLATADGTTITTDQYGEAVEYTTDAAAHLAQAGVATSEVQQDGQLQIDLQRKPIEVITDMGDLIVQASDTTGVMQTQLDDKPFIATRVEMPRTNADGITMTQKITQTTITPARTSGSKGQGVSILLKCEKCDQVFFTASDLKSHREKVHGAAPTIGKLASIVYEQKVNEEGDGNRNLCSICHIICPSVQALIKHKQEKHGLDMPFKCDQCNYSTTQKKYLEVHVKTHQKTFKCTVCQKYFESEEKLQKHVTTHSRDKYQCFYCSKMYLTRKACTDHIALKHSGPQKNVQFVETKKEIAPAASTSSPALGANQSSHVAQTDYDTGMGDNLLTEKQPGIDLGDNLLQDNLDQLANVAAAQADSQAPKIEVEDNKTEEEKVSEALQALEEASATYKYTEETQSATDTIADESFFGDDNADSMDTTESKTSSGKSDLEKLADGAVDIQPGPSMEPSPQKSPEGMEDFTPIKNKNFTCLGCYAEFPTELLYQNHFLKDHSDENMCLICGRDFSKRYLLRIHFHETHCNKDVYKCKSCSKMFNMVSKYWQHAQIHARRHVCRICSKAFSSATEMKRHETTVHYKSYFCVYCPMTFTSAADLRKHKEDTHGMKRHKKENNTTPKPAVTKGTSGTIIAGATSGSAKSLIQQAKESGTQMTIKIFRDGTYMTTDPNTGKTDYGTIDLSNLGLDPSLLQTHNDLELVIIPPDKDEEQKDTTASESSTPKPANEPKPVKATPDGEEDRSFSCRFCPRTFRFYRHLRCHEAAHGRDETYVCHICKRMFVREENLKLHLNLHEKKKVKATPKKTPQVETACNECGKVFQSKSKLNRHMKDTHNAEPISCQVCGRSFRNESNLQRHMKQHYGPFPCTYCSEIFEDKDVLNEHVKEAHQIKVHTCHLCNKELFSFGKLLSHLKTAHPEDENAVNEVRDNAKCDICQKKFATPKSMRTHRLTHTGEKKYQCPHCPWKFYLAYKLRRHIKVHEKSNAGKTRFPCDFCMRDFFSQAALDKHEKQDHNGPFQCHLCKAKKFPTKDKLKEHAEEKHSGNCFKCDACEQPFSCGRHLQIHIMSSHLKSVVCDLCGFSFSRKEEMYEHLKFNHFDGDEEKFRAEYPDIEVQVEKTDYDELKKTCTCPSCNKTFKAYSGLMSHMKSCDGNGEKEEEEGEESPVKSEEASTKIDKKKLRDNPVCPDCGKKFTVLSAVLSHMRYCKKGKKSAKSASPSKAKKELEDELSDSKDYVPYTYLETGHFVKCDKCQKTFSKRESLKKHMLTHAGISKKTEGTKGKSGKGEKKEDTSFDQDSEKKIEDKTSKSKVNKASKYYDLSKLKCEKCKIAFTNLYSLKKHLVKRHPESGIKMDTKLVKDSVSPRAKKNEPKVEPKTEEELTEIAKNQFLQMNFSLGIKTEPSSDLTSPVIETVKTKRHYCSLCGLKFSREATLKKHLIEIHDEADYEEPETESSLESDSMETEPVSEASPVKTRRMRGSQTSTPKIKTEPEESTPRTSQRQKLKRGAKESTPKLDTSKVKVKKEVEENEPTPKAKGRKVAGKTPEVLTRSMLTGRKFPKSQTVQKETFKCMHCEKSFEYKKTLERHLKYNHKDVKKIVTSLSTFKALRNKKVNYDLRVKKKFPSFPKSKSRKVAGKSEPETKTSKVKSPQVHIKTEPQPVKELKRKFQSRSDTLKQNKPKHLIKPTVSSKAKHTAQKSIHKSQHGPASKQVKTPKPSFTKKPKKMPMTMVLGGILSQFLKKRVNTIFFECEFCKLQFPDKVKLNFHRRTKHSSKVQSKSICECYICNEVFIELRQLLSHMATAHKVEKKKVEEIITEDNSEHKSQEEMSLLKSESQANAEESEAIEVENKIEPDKTDTTLNQTADKIAGGIDKSTEQAQSPVQNLSEAFALDSDLTSQYIELQKNGAHKETDESFLESESTTNEAAAGSKIDGNTFDSVEMSQTVSSESGLKHMEIDGTLQNDELTATSGAKFLDDADVESLTSPVVHDVDMFTGKRTETQMERQGKLSGQSSKSGNQNRTMKCQVCLKRFHTEEGYSKHIKTHTLLKYECPKCDAFFRWEKNLKTHIQLFHSDKDILICRVCSRYFNDKNMLEKHQLVHQTTRFPCLKCKKNFSNKSVLKNHITEVHKSKEMGVKNKTGREMMCGVCSLKFETIELLLNHILVGHSRNEPAKMLFRERLFKYRCKFCPLFFKTKESQMSHLKICDKRTVLAKKLYGQELSDNTCSVCGLKFKTKSQTFRHMQKIHGHGSKFQHIDFLKHPTIQTKYYCENCNGTFAKYSSYMMHEKALYGICSKKKKSSKHERCPFCKVLFASRLILGKHMIKVHNNYLFHSWKHCPYCKESFSRRVNLRKHLQAAHPEELNEGKRTAKSEIKKAEVKKLVKKEGKEVKKVGRKPIKKGHSRIDVEQLVKKGNLTQSKEDHSSETKDNSELENKYRKIRLSTGIERHKCEYCGRVSWTIGSYEEHLSKYHADRWIERSVDSPGIASSPGVTSSPLRDPSEVLHSASSDDKKLGALPVVMIHRLPVDLLVQSSDNAVPEEKPSPDKYLGVPYSFSDDVKKEGSAVDKELVKLPLVDLDSVENLPDLALEQKASISTDAGVTDLQKEEVEDYLKPVTGSKISTDTIGIPESLPDEILASNVGTPVKHDHLGKEVEMESESSEYVAKSETGKEKTELDTPSTQFLSDENIAYQEMTAETENITGQFEGQMVSDTGFGTDIDEKDTEQIENGKGAAAVDPGMPFSSADMQESAGYEEMEYEEMQMEGLTSTESHSVEMGTKGMQDENLGEFIQNPLEKIIEENGNL